MLEEVLTELVEVDDDEIGNVEVIEIVELLEGELGIVTSAVVDSSVVVSSPATIL